MTVQVKFAARAVGSMVALLCMMPGVAVAQSQPASSAMALQLSPAQCAAAYYQALEPVRTGRGAVLTNLFRAFRTPEPDWTGKWMFTSTVFNRGKAPPQPKSERVCAEQKEVKGRLQCARFELKQPPPPPPETLAKLPHTPDELRYLKQVHDFAESKGALPDVGANGRQTFLVQRIAQDIRLYATQPEHPALCAGSKEMVEFYGGQLAPIKKRGEELVSMSKQVKDHAALRVRNIAITELKLYETAVAEAKAVAEAAAKKAAAVAAAAAAKAAADAAAATSATGAAPAAPAAPAVPVAPVVVAPELPPRPAGPAQVSDYAVVSFNALAAEALRPLLPQPMVIDITAEKSPLAILAKARAALLDPENKADKAPAEIRDASYMALRMLEARAYTERYAARYRELDQTLADVIGDMKSAQTKACTCKE